jgi:hypothetical protein
LCIFLAIEGQALFSDIGIELNFLTKKDRNFPGQYWKWGDELRTFAWENIKIPIKIAS